MKQAPVILLISVLALWPTPQTSHAESNPAPKRVSVLPVFFVPSDQPQPTVAQQAALIKHLRIAQARYKELLGGRDTFRLEKTPLVYVGRHPLLAYRPLPGDASHEFAAELLAHLKTDRFTCPYVLAIVVMNPCENWPAGGARPLNCGFNHGGGFVEVSSYGLDKNPGFQGTLQHELGHGFGLVHVDAYGYSMTDNESLMSYNPKHHTAGFEPSKTPGILIPEDIRALALNDRAFGKLEFKPSKDVPAGYKIQKIAQLPAWPIPGEASFEEDVAKREKGGSGFELFVGGKRVAYEPTWNRRNALARLRKELNRKSKKPVEGRFNGHVLHADEKGYQLFFNGVRVGHEPAWTMQQAIENLRGNRSRRPQMRVEGRYNGELILWAEPTGYELFFNGVRVGHEPKWTKEQGLANLRFNLKANAKQHVSARFEGVELRIER